MNLYIYPHEMLKKKLQALEEWDESLRDTLNEMHKFMITQGGVGLAANQVGIDKRLIVVRTKHRVFKLINPRIVQGEGEVIYKESCLSLPGRTVETKRYKKVVVDGYDEDGDEFTYTAGGLLAIIFQHEIDHLDGKTILDRRNI